MLVKAVTIVSLFGLTIFYMISASLLVGCNEMQRIFAPSIISSTEYLDKNLQELLESSLRDKICDDIVAAGFECQVPEQLSTIKFIWLHDAENRVQYELEFCLKVGCPVEEQLPTSQPSP